MKEQLRELTEGKDNQNIRQLWVVQTSSLQGVTRYKRKELLCLIICTNAIDCLCDICVISNGQIHKNVERVALKPTDMEPAIINDMSATHVSRLIQLLLALKTEVSIPKFSLFLNWHYNSRHASIAIVDDKFLGVLNVSHFILIGPALRAAMLHMEEYTTEKLIWFLKLLIGSNIPEILLRQEDGQVLAKAYVKYAQISHRSLSTTIPLQPHEMIGVLLVRLAKITGLDWNTINLLIPLWATHCLTPSLLYTVDKSVEESQADYAAYVDYLRVASILNSSRPPVLRTRAISILDKLHTLKPTRPTAFFESCLSDLSEFKKAEHAEMSNLENLFSKIGTDALYDCILCTLLLSAKRALACTSREMRNIVGSYIRNMTHLNVSVVDGTLDNAIFVTRLPHLKRLHIEGETFLTEGLNVEIVRNMGYRVSLATISTTTALFLGAFLAEKPERVVRMQNGLTQISLEPLQRVSNLRLNISSSTELAVLLASIERNAHLCRLELPQGTPLHHSIIKQLGSAIAVNYQK